MKKSTKRLSNTKKVICKKIKMFRKMKFKKKTQYKVHKTLIKVSSKLMVIVNLMSQSHKKREVESLKKCQKVDHIVLSTLHSKRQNQKRRLK